LVWTSEKGAVTAEFMLLLPGLVLLFAISLSSFSLALSKVQLEVSAFEIAREQAIGIKPLVPAGVSLQLETEGRLSCAKLTKQGLFPLTARTCMIRYGA
jgi:hypothetical protein